MFPGAQFPCTWAAGEVRKDLPGEAAKGKQRSSPEGMQQSALLVLLSTDLCAWHTGRSNKQKHWSLEQRKVYFGTRKGGWVAHAPKALNSLKYFSKTCLKESEGGDFWLLRASWCGNPLFLLLSMYVRSLCSCKPPTRQRQILFSALQVFISTWMEKCYTHRSQIL